MGKIFAKVSDNIYKYTSRDNDIDHEYEKEEGMRFKQRKIFLAAALGIAVLCGCGKDVVIDVNALPCGTARGNAASGNFSYSGLVVSDNCKAIPTFLTYDLLDGAAAVVVNHYEPSVAGCEVGRMEVLFPATGTVPEFTLKGGLWTDGSFRIGQAVLVPSGDTFRILFDGKYAPVEVGDPPQDHFSGKARVDIDTGDGSCTYKVEFTATRQP